MFSVYKHCNKSEECKYKEVKTSPDLKDLTFSEGILFTKGSSGQEGALWSRKLQGWLVGLWGSRQYIPSRNNDRTGYGFRSWGSEEQEEGRKKGKNRRKSPMKGQGSWRGLLLTLSGSYSSLSLHDSPNCFSHYTSF